jgi:hypothetical protein
LDVRARDEELGALRSQVANILAAAEGYERPHVVAVAEGGTHGSIWDSIRCAVTVTELRRRLRTQAVRLASWDPAGRDASWTGEPIESWSPGDRDDLDRAARQYDALVVPELTSLVDPIRMLADLSERGCGTFLAGSAVDWEAEGPPGLHGFVRGGPSGRSRRMPSAPDPLVLADRLVDPRSLSLRVDFLRITGRLGAPDPYVLVMMSGDEADAGDVAKAAADLARARDSSVVVVPTLSGRDRGSATWEAILPALTRLEPAAEIDLLALVAGATLILTDCGPAASLALSLGRPLVAIRGDRELEDLSAWIGDPDFPGEAGDMLGQLQAAEGRSGDAALRSRLGNAVETAYDDLADALRRCAARQLSIETPDILSAMQSRIRDLDRANRALQARLRSERDVLAAYAKSVTQPVEGVADPAEVSALRKRLVAAEKAARAAQESADAQRRELEAIKSTKTMRLLAPVRSAYGRLRRRS